MGGALIAVVDVGSNSVRLLLARGMDEDGAEGERIVTVTGLRRGAQADGTVSHDALLRLDACLADYGEMIRAAGSPPVVAVGTAAVREAPNRADIAAVVARHLGTTLVVVEGQREAALAFAGARLALPAYAGPCRVIDIGGGSTEIVQGGAMGPVHVVSLPLGSTRQAERHIRHDPPGADAVRAIISEAEALVRAAAREFPVGGPVVGVAGTVTQVAAIHIGVYDPVRIHRMYLSRLHVEEVLTRVAPLTRNERREVAGLHPDRLDVIVPGAAILVGVLAGLRSDGLTVSERDILDGTALDPDLAGGLLSE